MSIIHKPGSRVNRNPIVPHLRDLKAPALAASECVLGPAATGFAQGTRWDLVLFALMKLGAAQGKVPAAYRLVDVDVPEYGAGFTYALNRKKLRRVRRREGRYLQRTTRP